MALRPPPHVHVTNSRGPRKDIGALVDNLEADKTL
jgi:hypothetical protein